MDRKYKEIKKILTENTDKSMLILGTIGINFNNLKYQLKAGELYQKVLDDLFISKYGYININQNDIKSLEALIEVKKGEPLFSNKIVPCDLVIFIYVNPKILRILCAKENVSYDEALKLQYELLVNLHSNKYAFIKVELYKNSIGLDHVGRNVYICGNYNGFLTDKRDMIKYEDENNTFFHFPYIKHIKNITDLQRKQGFLLLIYDNFLEVKDCIDIDKKYRKLFNHFNLVYIITKDTNKLKQNYIKYSNINFTNDIFDDYGIIELYYDYILNTERINFSSSKLKVFSEIDKFLKNKKTIKTSDLVNKYNISIRQAERYIIDYNKLYKNIGYDYSKNEWYIIH